MKTALLLSGGVDSSVALQLLKEKGHSDIQPFYLKIWLEDELAFLGDCPWEEDIHFAQGVCKNLGLDLKVISLQTEYRERVVEHTLSELRAGRTPSPDILCNPLIKFGAFFERVGEDFDCIASGHYAQIKKIKGLNCLLRAPDPVKDQSYFLSRMRSEQLDKISFPIGHLKKTEVRELAKKYDLINQDRKDSQGICFLGKISYRDFTKFHLGEKEGCIVDKDSGKILGKHRGFWFHTIGQRQGLGLGGGPWYVVGKDISENVVYVSHNQHVADHRRSIFEAGQVHWIHSAPQDKTSLLFKLRHGPELISGHIEDLGDQRIRVFMDHLDSGVAAGQYVVVYEGEVCLGSAIIEDARDVSP